MSDFREFLSLQKHNVNDRLSKQATQVFDHGLKLQKLEDALRRIDHQIELKEAKLYNSIAQKYQAIKTVTATRVNNEVTSHPEIIELKEKRLDLLKAIGVAKLKMKTLEIFNDSLINYSHNVREESKSSKLKKI